MKIINLLILLVIIVLFMSTTYKIAENFVNIDNPYLPDKYLHEYVNQDLLEHSIKCNDEKVKEYIESILCGKSCSMNAIKYIEGTIWTKWIEKCNDSIKEISHRIYTYLKNKLKDSDIIYAKINKYRKNTKDAKEIMIDYDFVYHNKKDMYAYQIKIVCVVNLCTKAIRMIYVNLVGAICEDKIYMKSNENNKNMVQIPKKYSHNLDNAFESESQKCISTHDIQVKDLLYQKIEEDNYENDENYKKNQDYIRNQNIVRNMFLNDLKKDVKTTNKYKKYPYTNDFEICTS